MKLTLGTNTSNLAMWQANHIQAKLQTVWPELVCEIRPYSIQDDETQKANQPPPLGSNKQIINELENGLKLGEVDIAVHSLKDLPAKQSDNIVKISVTTDFFSDFLGSYR